MLNEYFSFQSVVEDHNTFCHLSSFSHESLEIFEIRPLRLSKMSLMALIRVKPVGLIL